MIQKIHYILIAFLIFLVILMKNSLDFVSDINAPSNVDFVIDISEDNQAIVKITPFGDGLLNATVDFGDDSELSEEIGHQGILLFMIMMMRVLTILQ